MANINRQKQQYIALAIGVVAVLGLGGLIFGVLGPKNPTATPFSSEPQGVDMTIVQDRTSSAAPEMSWITQSRAEIERLRQTVESLNQGITAERTQAARTIAQLREDYDDVLLQQATQISELEARADAAPVAPPAGNGQGQVPNANGAFTPDYSATGSEFIERRTGFTPSGQTPVDPNRRQGAAQNLMDENGNAIAPSFGQTFALTAVEVEATEEERNTLRNYIPAGSYASAVVLSGADAATNVADRESPVPVLFRITGPAITAARGGRRGAEINIEGCTVQGSAIGDLSSERVRVRLLTLTCIKRNGEVVEQAISGYMVGAGKAGVRGRVISREGGLVANAAIAGVLGGLANAASSATGNTDGANSLGEIVTGAATAAGVGGVQTAAQTLSEYYINRAEQYQPVITLNGGSVVELVFMEGISLR